jgi:predicted TIM-barrel fold metal-dependent hydrolase
MYKEQPKTQVDFAVPLGACDTHFHTYGDPARFPFADPRSASNPVPATPEEALALWRFLHIQRHVIIQPSAYGTDNSQILNSLKQFGPSTRGIAVIDGRTKGAALDEMDLAGIRGIRLTLREPAVAPARFSEAIDWVRGRNWHVQLQTEMPVVESLKGLIASAKVPVVVDHFGGARASLGLGQPGFQTLIDLVSAGHVFVKVTRLHQISTAGPDYADATPFAKALIAANVERILWGTDWPHVGGPDGYDDGLVMNQLAIWAPDAATRKTILVDNPARLYQF